MANKELTRIRSELATEVNNFNDLMWSGKAKQSEIAELNEKIDKLVKDYTSIKEKDVFDECAKSGDAMLEAVKRLSFLTIAVKDEKGEAGDSANVTRKIVEKEKDIDLAKLHKKLGGIGKDAHWIYMVEKFNCLLTMRAANELGIDPQEINDSYYMDKLSRDVEMGKNPTSNTNIVKTLQMVVNAMVGEEFKATSHDMKFIDKTYTRKSRQALTVACANHRQLRAILAQVCHKLVCDMSYSVDYKKIK